MKRLFWRLAPEMVWCLAIAGSVGCSDPNNSVPAGPPVLNSWSVVDNATGASLDLSTDGSPIQITGYVHLNALFDRLLDANHGDRARRRRRSGNRRRGDLHLRSGAARELELLRQHDLHAQRRNDRPGFSLGPSLATMANPTFPSGSTVTAKMDKTKVRSKKGEPFTGDGDLATGQLAFQTLPFSVSIGVPMGDANPDAGADAGPPAVSPMMQAVTLAFTNLPSATPESFITVTVNGTAYADFTVTPESNPTVLDVTPMTTWPPNATVVVNVSATATDALGGLIDAAASGTFTTRWS